MSESSESGPLFQNIQKSFLRLYRIISKLRSPDGCAWDREQSPASLRESLIEEAYECINAVDEKNDENLKEELGDLFLLLTMIIRMKEEENIFSLTDVLNGICEKLIRRHPHVFGNSNFGSSDIGGSEKGTVTEIIEQWDSIKENIEGKRPQNSILERIPKALPPLERAFQIQRTVGKIGFDWDRVEPVWEKVQEEIDEVKRALQTKDPTAVEGEIGDLLFTIVNLSRFLKVNPTGALNRTNQKFTKRFRNMEQKIKESEMELKSMSLEKMDAFWNQAKLDEKRGTV